MATINWQPTPDPLVQAKSRKSAELDTACNQAILGHFIAQVDGVTYSFSNDSEAQSNFSDAKTSWIDNDMLPEDVLPWTAYDTDGNVVRLQLNKAQFDPINRARMQWKLDCISKYRDDLLPRVNVATTPDDVNVITWEGTT